MITQTPFADLIGVFEPDSEEWHNARRGITGSDIGAILGVSPFKSAYTLWAEKRGLISDRIDENDAMTLGKLFEEPIGRMFQKKNPGYTFIKTGTWVSKSNENYKANPDALIEDADGNLGVLEIKHTSQFWDELPKTYFEQVHWYLDVLGLDYAIVAAVSGGRYKEFYIDYNAEYADVVRSDVEGFQRLVNTDTEPDWDGSTSTYETVRTLAPGLTDSEIELGHLWVNLSNAKQRYDEAETLLNAFKSATLAQMDGAKRGTYNGETVVQLQARNGKPFLTFK